MNFLSKSLCAFLLLIMTYLFVVPPAHAAYFSITSDNTKPTVGNETTVTVQINTESQLTNGADTVISYNKDLFQIGSISFGTLYTSTFSQINSTGSVSLSAAVSDASQGFAGSGTFATLRVKAIQEGNSVLTVDCGPSSIWLKNGNGEDLLSCDKNQSLSLTANPAKQDPTPQGTPLSIPYRGSCTAPQPPAPTGLSATPGPGNGQITLIWNSVFPVTHYGINYGTSPGRYSKGAGNIGNVASYIMSGLTPDTLYYFTVYAVNDCATSPLSVEAWAAASNTLDIFESLESTKSATPSSEEEILEEMAPVETTSTRWNFLSRANPFFIWFLGAGAVTFLTVLYLLGKKNTHASLEHIEIPPQHHGEPIEETVS